MVSRITAVKSAIPSFGVTGPVFRTTASTPAISRRAKGTASENAPTSSSGASTAPPLSNELVEPTLQVFRPADGIGQIERRLGPAEQQVSVRPEHAGHPGEDRLLSVYVKVDHHVPQEHQVEQRERGPRPG